MATKIDNFTLNNNGVFTIGQGLPGPEYAVLACSGGFVVLVAQDGSKFRLAPGSGVIVIPKASGIVNQLVGAPGDTITIMFGENLGLNGLGQVVQGQTINQVNQVGVGAPNALTQPAPGNGVGAPVGLVTSLPSRIRMYAFTSVTMTATAGTVFNVAALGRANTPVGIGVRALIYRLKRVSLAVNGVASTITPCLYVGYSDVQTAGQLNTTPSPVNYNGAVEEVPTVYQYGSGGVTAIPNLYPYRIGGSAASNNACEMSWTLDGDTGPAIYYYAAGGWYASLGLSNWFVINASAPVAMGGATVQSAIEWEVEVLR